MRACRETRSRALSGRGAGALILLLACGLWSVACSPGTEAGNNAVASSNDAPKANDDREEPGDSPANGAAEKDPKTNPDNDPSSKGDAETDPESAGSDPLPGPEPDPPLVHSGGKMKWRAVRFETVVEGTVTLQSSGIPAAGATVKARRLDDELFMRRWADPADSVVPVGEMPSEEKPPEPVVFGEAITDDAGCYELTVAITLFKPFDPLLDAKYLVEPDPVSPWEVYVRAEIAASKAGYAPAIAEVSYLAPGGRETIHLYLAPPTAVRGRVVDAVTRKPVTTAVVEFVHQRRGDDNDFYGSATRYVEVEEDGSFEVNDLPAGEYEISPGAPGYLDVRGQNGGDTYYLAAGSERNLGALTLLQLATVGGKVVDAETGDPVLTAGISVASANSTPYAETDMDGGFLVRDVRPGPFSLVVRAEGYARLELSGWNIDPGENLDAGILPLVRGAELTVRVLGDDGAPMEGVEVNATENLAGSKAGYEPPFVGTTDAQGDCRFEGLTPGEWSVAVEVEGFAPRTTPIEVRGEGAALEIRLTRGGVIRGRLLDCDGLPVEGAGVVVIPQDSYSWFWQNPLISPEEAAAGWLSWADEYTTDADGRFEIPCLAPGTYGIVAGYAGEPGRAARAALVYPVIVEDEAVTEGVELRFPALGAVVVRVVEGGRPVADLGLVLGSFNSYFSAESIPETDWRPTDVEGEVRFEGLGPGLYVVRTRKDPDWGDMDIIILLQRRSMRLQAGETIEFVIDLDKEAGCAVSGQLTAAGVPVFSKAVIIGLDVLSFVRQVEVLEDGFFRFEGIPPGRYELYGVSAQQLRGRVVLEVEEGREDVYCNADLAGHAVTGTVRTPTGQASDTALVRVVARPIADRAAPRLTPYMEFSAWCDEDGRFSLTGLMDGRYVVSAQLPGTGYATTVVNVEGMDCPGLNLNIASYQGGIRLRIKEIKGASASYFTAGQIKLFDGSGFAVPLSEQSYAYFTEGSVKEFPQLAPGRYRIELGSDVYAKTTAEAVVPESGFVDVEVVLYLAATLNVNVTNAEVDQELLDHAEVVLLNETGDEIRYELMIETLLRRPAAFARPTLRILQLGPEVRKVRITVEGYEPVEIEVSFQPGAALEEVVTLVPK